MAVSVKADAVNLAMQYGHLAPTYDSDEREMELDMCDYVGALFWYDDWDFCEPINAYWDYTADNYVSDCLVWQRDNAHYVTNLWIGDFHASDPPTPGPYGHLWFYGNNSFDISDDSVHDSVTQYGSQTSKEYFNFFWTCANGGRYWTDSSGNYDDVYGITEPASSPFNPPPYNTNDEYGFFNPVNTNYGMPFAWTGRLDMDLDGYNSYSGSYCVIGWEGPSPFMINYLENTTHPAASFLYNFYVKALGYEDWYHQTIQDSLDYAAALTYNCDFDQTPLYNGYWKHVIIDNVDYGWFFVHMRVLGNAGMIIPMWE